MNEYGIRQGNLRLSMASRDKLRSIQWETGQYVHELAHTYTSLPSLPSTKTTVDRYTRWMGLDRKQPSLEESPQIPPRARVPGVVGAVVSAFALVRRWASCGSLSGGVLAWALDLVRGPKSGDV